MISWCRARRARAPLSVLHFRTILVQGPREHHRAALSPARVGQRWHVVRLLGTAVTGSLSGRSFQLILADFSWIDPIIPKSIVRFLLITGQKHGNENFVSWVCHIFLNHSVRKCFYRGFTRYCDDFDEYTAGFRNHNRGYDFEIFGNLYVHLYLKIS